MNRLDPLKLDLHGTSLIEASAGTGKTFTIATLYLRLLLERNLVVSEILVVTYTRAASAELRGRIRARILDAIDALETALETGAMSGDLALDGMLAQICTEPDRKLAIRRLSAALAGFDEAAILTIHGFCQRVLRENAFECQVNFDVELLTDQVAMLEEIVSDYWSNAIATEPETFIRYLITHKTHVQSLVQLAQIAGGAEPLPLVPEPRPVTEERLETLEDAWSRAFRSVHKSWANSGSEVIAQLHAAALAGDLSKQKYKPAVILDRWMREMDQVLAIASPVLAERSAILERFTPECLTRRTNKNKTTPEHAFFVACGRLAEADEKLCEALAARKIGFEHELITTVESQSRLRKNRKGQQSYDDLLWQVERALDRDGGSLLSSHLRNQYRAAMVDEFQDTDRLQYQILRKIWHQADPASGGDELSSSALFLIGDPKQAIYAFRGADVFTYLMAKRDAGECCYTLDTNWRSDPSMIRAVNVLFSRSNSPFRLEGIPFESIAPRPSAEDQLDGGDDSQAGEESVAALDILFMSRPDAKPLTKARLRTEIPSRVAADIARLVRGPSKIAESRVQPGDVVVLCRTNQQTEEIRSALRSLAVPAAILGSSSVFDADEAMEVGRVLDAVAHPGSQGRVRAALSTRIFGLAGEALDALTRREDDWDHRLSQFRHWQKGWVERGFIHMFHQLLREERVHVRLLSLEGGERRLTNLLHIAELLEQAARSEHLGPSELVEWLRRMRRNHSLRDNAIGDADELRLEGDDEAVRIVTVHKSKGIEYPIVYCPFAWEGARLSDARQQRVRFHDVARDNQWVLDLGSDQINQHRDVASEESRAEAVRALYVSLTRAKHRCSIIWGNFRDADRSPLAPLLHPSTDSSDESGDAKSIPLKQMSDEQMRSEIAELTEASQGAIALRELGDKAASPEEFVTRSHALKRVRGTRKLSTSWRHSSFSALTAGDHTGSRDDLSDASHGSTLVVEEGLDHDAVSEFPILETRTDVEAEVRLNPFPAGAAAGTLLHAILEHLDFEKPARDQPRDLVGDALEAHHFEPSWRGLLCDALDRIAKTRWGEGAPCLAELPQSKRLDELEFLLPVLRREQDGVSRTAMTVADLSTVFEHHARSPFQRDYAKRLASLRFEPLAGYLKGYIDLVFEWNGRFYLVDYKSNHLGPSHSNYDAASLEAPMSEHHYVLQYHLYTVALDRYLAHRIKGYDYDTHFGGAYYLFLRGMDPEHPTGCGVFHDRPTRQCVDSLSATLTHPVGAFS